jgi:hypothetical protein
LPKFSTNSNGQVINITTQDIEIPTQKKAKSLYCIENDENKRNLLQDKKGFDNRELKQSTL